jgi:putative peptidoglycan lipid II flippase
MSAGKTREGSEEQALVRAAGQIGFYTLLSRITGLLRDIVIGSVFGASASADAFFVAFRIPNLLRRLVGEGATAAAFVPVITEYLTQRSREETMVMVRALFGAGIAVLLVLTVAGIVWAAPLTHLFAPGFSPAKLTLTTTLTRMTFLYLFCIGLVALAMGVLYALRHFAAPAFAPILLNVALILCALGLSSHLAEPVFSLAYGVVLGGLCQFLWQLPALIRLRVPLIPRWQPRHPAIHRVATLLLPVLFGAAVYQISLLVNTLLASLLAEGSVSSLWYASQLFEFPLAIFSTALNTAALPSLATQVQQRNLEGVRTSLGFALGLVNFVTIPAAVGLATLAVPITAVLFFHGAFHADQVLATAAALRGFAVGLWSVAIARLFSSCFYALEDTRTPVYTGVIAFIANVCFSLMLMGVVSTNAEAHSLGRFFAGLGQVFAVYDLGAEGLALAASLAATVNLVLLSGVLSRRLGQFPWSAWISSFLWSVLASAVMAVLVRWITQQIDWLNPDLPFTVRLAMLGLAVAAGVVSFTLIAWYGGRNELHALTGMLPERVLRLLPQLFQARK